MGLDITAYSRLVPASVTLPDEDDADYDERMEQVYDDHIYDDHIRAFAYDSFPQSTRGLKDHDVVSINGFIADSWYSRTIDTEEHDFPAGSYSGYGAWRDDLAVFGLQCLQRALPANPDDLRVPFIELTYFADSEGCIGPDAAKDLLADFKTHEMAYVESHSMDDIESYNDWMRACELAADGGLIQFH